MPVAQSIARNDGARLLQEDEIALLGCAGCCRAWSDMLAGTRLDGVDRKKSHSHL